MAEKRGMEGIAEEVERKRKSRLNLKDLTDDIRVSSLALSNREFFATSQTENEATVINVGNSSRLRRKKKMKVTENGSNYI